MTPLASV